MLIISTRPVAEIIQAVSAASILAGAAAAWANAGVAASAISSAAKSGQIGDGKIFVYDLGRAVRIRTGETDNDAL